MLKKIGIGIGILIVLVIAVLIGGYYYLLKMPLPQTDGDLQVRGLKAPVRVYRDAWGVPHIYAQNEHDLLFAQGFVQAQDRLFQMEMNRRLAAGRLSEIIGPDPLPLDRLLRTLGFMRAARREVASYDEETKKLLGAFSDGVNACVDSTKGRLPIEFRLLGITPEPWRPEHSIAWAKVMALLGGKNWQEEIVRAMVVQKVGAEKAAALFRLNRPETPTIIPPGLNWSALLPKDTNLTSVVLNALGGASNNWAVHGSRTSTGAPLLANDMHLAVRIPSVWYEMHLVGGNLNVIGLALAGVPLIIAGHNQDLAWGITFAYTDVQDIFLERLKPDEPGRYFFRGQWEKAEVITETIYVKGRDKPMSHQVIKTRHGPIISPLLPSDVGAFTHALAFKWSAYDPGNMAPTLYALNIARGWEDFKEAAQEWTEPPINLVYADREGNIGYLLGSRIPLRPQQNGMGPFPAWTGEYEWTGYLPSHKKPFLLNPPQGFVATANNQVVGPEYPFYLAQDYAPGFREARITEVLLKKDQASKVDFKALQGDFKCIPAARFMKALEGMEGQSPEARDLMKKLRSWDRNLGPESVGGAIYSVLYHRMMENTFRDEMGDLADRFYGVGLTYLEPLNRFVGHSRVIFLRLMDDPQSPWFDDITTPETETLTHVLEKSLNETAVYLREKLGPDPSAWRWGRLHQIEFLHPVGRKKPLDRIFNIGPFEVGGSFSTVWQAAVRPDMDFKLKGWTASNRHIYDLKDWDKSVGSIVPGQSGILTSPHYGDQVELWLRVEHHPLYYSQDKVVSESKSILTLKP